MYKTYRFRLYPTDNQRTLIHKTFGCYRFIYNYFLNQCKSNGYQKAYDMCKELKELYTNYPWLKEVDSCSLRCAIFNLEDAYKNFFAKRSSYPTFKNKFHRQSYRTNCIRSSYKGKEYSNIELDFKRRKIKVPKLGWMDIRGYRKIEVINGRIINVTISYEKTGKYYISVLVEEKEIIKQKQVPTNIVGIDLGVKDLVITSDGEKYRNPKELIKREKRLKRLQRKLSRQERGSKNYQKSKRKIAILHEKIKNSRKHYMIGIVNKLISTHDIIVTEKLNVKEMIQRRRLSKYIMDASFHKICEMLKWKSEVEGKNYYQIDTYYPSSQICSVCGKKKEEVKQLNIREWKCENCGREHNRDINASINIMMEGLRLHYQS